MARPERPVAGTYLAYPRAWVHTPGPAIQAARGRRRAAIVARRLGVNGQVTGAWTAGYYWPSATLREFIAVFLSYKVVNLGICALIVVLPFAYIGAESLRGHW